jgi:hypothetical protein
MIDLGIQLWNVLHDGEITVLERNHDVITVFVSIPYVRRRMKPIGDSFKLVFYGVSQFEYVGNDGSIAPIEEEIENCPLTVLHTESKEFPVRVVTTMGDIIANYTDFEIYLDVGKRIEISELFREFDRYWDEWERLTKQVDPAADRQR